MKMSRTFVFAGLGTLFLLAAAPAVVDNASADCPDPPDPRDVACAQYTEPDDCIPVAVWAAGMKVYDGREDMQCYLYEDITYYVYFLLGIVWCEVDAAFDLTDMIDCVI